MLAHNLQVQLQDAPEALDAFSDERVSAPLQRPADSADRRGPLRPERLASSRERYSGKGLAVLFRAGDLVAVAALTVWTMHAGASAGLLGVTLGQALPLLVAAAALLWALKACHAYRFGLAEPLSRHVVKLALAAIAGGGAALAASVLLGWSGVTTPGLWAVAAFLTLSASHAVWFAVIAHWRRTGRLTPNVFIVGATPNAERLIQGALRTREVNVLGVFDDRGDRGPAEVCGVPMLGDTRALLEHRLLPYVDKVVITVQPAAQGRVRDLIERLRVLPQAVTLLLEDTDASVAATLSRVADVPLAFVSGRPGDELRAAVKRAQDLVVGGLGLLAVAPVMAVVALAIKLDSPGPVFFRQRREGFNNEAIIVWKFRSMRNEPAPTSVVRQITEDDPRVTRVGRFIRKTSLDELPQLFNVLKGDMSLVGPRPHAPGMMTGDVESRRLVAEYAHRHRLKPGLTGWAAVKGSRGAVDTPDAVRERVALDLQYIERQSFWLDLWIMLVTVPVLLGDRSAVR
jgi:Undecaprenyl-phosphate glucose phosphotransferase